MRTIKSKDEFERVFSQGRRVSHRLVRMTALVSGEGDLGRVAFVAPKRLGNAVHRNRCKRILREAARRAQFPREGLDVILFATQATFDSNLEELVPVLGKLLAKASEGVER